MSVTILCPNARRCYVKVTPSKLLREVLEEACLKSGFDVDGHQLVNQGRCVDLALPFRLSGLPNNATLEMLPMARTDATTVATIALQVPDGSRLECEFPVTMTLFSILEYFSRTLSEDLVATKGHSVPSCSYMNRQYVGQIELQKTTLLSIGISSGKCLIRYHRMALTEEQMDEINARIACEAAEKQALLIDYAQKKAENERRKELDEIRLARFEEESRLMRKRKQSLGLGPADNVTSTDMITPQSFHVSVSSTSTNLPSDQTNSSNRFSNEVDTSSNYQLRSDHHEGTGSTLENDPRIPLSHTAEVSNPVLEENTTTALSPLTFPSPCDRRAVIFLRQTSEDSTSKREEVSDEFFEINLEDVRAQLRQLQEEVHTAANRALLPKNYVKQKNREGKLLAYRHTVIRIPVGTARIVQAQFQSAEPISRLFEWVRGISSSNADFSLKLALNRKLENSDSLNFVDADLAPKSTVFIKFSDPSVDFESLCVGSLHECSQSEADNSCFEWLSQNTVFKPFTGVVDDGESIISKTTSVMSGKLPDHSVPTLRKSTTAPKWFKK